ncbi:hypothetical protein [Streptodolium elevatio]|uniref:Uncharacterized protein n=1 Tax=Streptodolium elevatio TaxID=3157996 RepID=A0ABV3D8W7_9ACTN
MMVPAAADAGAVLVDQHAEGRYVLVESARCLQAVGVRAAV